MKAQPTKGIDLEAQGIINGQSVYEYDTEALKYEDKPWKKPGKSTASIQNIIYLGLLLKFEIGSI